MNADQTRLARHALGLNMQKKSYRNRFIVPAGTPDCREWEGMVATGHARTDPKWTTKSGHLFVLTRAGAEAVLKPGETLDQTDFP